MKEILTLFCLACLLLPVSAKDFNVIDYGADTTCVSLSSDAINRAITACHEQGGGRVVLPRGRYLCGTLFLKSQVELRLERGAVISASTAYDDFPLQPRNHFRSQKDRDGWKALIFAADCHDIAITGEGTIEGNGGKRKTGLERVSKDKTRLPNNILLVSCRNIVVKGITVKDAPGWNQHYLNCERLTIEGITSWNHCYSNNDGIDIDCCRKVTIRHCLVDSDDDGIVLKSTGPIPCEDIRIDHCIVSSFANAIKCGTESVGGFRHITITDCTVLPSAHKGKRVVNTTPTGITALSLEMVDGGILENVNVKGLDIVGTECPIYIRLANRGRNAIDGLATAPAVPGVLRDVTISHVKVSEAGTFGSSITGIVSKCAERIVLKDVHVESRGGLKAGCYRHPGDDNGVRHDIAGNNHPDQYWASADQVAEDDSTYPQPTQWGNLPCHGLFVRHVRGLKMKNVTFSTKLPDPRQAVIQVDVRP